jgi:hypothetical protein
MRSNISRTSVRGSNVDGCSSLKVGSIASLVYLMAKEYKVGLRQQKVPRGQRDGSLRPYFRCSRPVPLFLPSSSSVVLTMLSRPVSDPLFLRKYGSAGNRTRISGSVSRSSNHYTTEKVRSLLCNINRLAVGIIFIFYSVRAPTRYKIFSSPYRLGATQPTLQWVPALFTPRRLL